MERLKGEEKEVAAFSIVGYLLYEASGVFVVVRRFR